MNKFFASAVAVTAIAITVVISGCNEKKEVVPNPDQSFEKVKSAGELVLGHMVAFPPMVFTNKEGNVVGFDVDLASEVCSRLGLKLKTVLIPWDAKEYELKMGHVDCIWSGMSVDSSRAVEMNLSDPYLTNRLVFVMKDKSVDHPDSLKGKKISVQRASTAQSMLVSSEVGNSAEVLVYDGLSAAFEALDSGIVDAAFTDEVFAKYWNLKNDNRYVIMEDVLHNEVYAVGFRKGDQALRDTINTVLASIKKDGKFVELSVKWFGNK